MGFACSVFVCGKKENMENHKALSGFYETANENERLESRPGMVEYQTTMHFIKRYAKMGDRIAEIGAGTGKYSCALARMGFRVDAVELMDKHIDIFREQITPEMNVTIQQGDATAMNTFQTESYDITLLLGPMYHLFHREDKLKALSEAIRITRKGGVIFAAYCMADAAIVQHGFLKGNTHALLDKGMLDPVTFETHSEPRDIFELYRKKQIDELREGFPV